MSYIEEQERAGFKKGDIVKVLRTASDGERGWANSWAEEMDNSVGHTYVVVETPKYSSGIRINDSCHYSYPYFVFEKIDTMKRPDIKVGSIWVEKDGARDVHFIIEHIKDDECYCRISYSDPPKHINFHTSIFEFATNYELIGE